MKSSASCSSRKDRSCVVCSLSMSAFEHRGPVCPGAPHRFDRRLGRAVGSASRHAQSAIEATRRFAGRALQDRSRQQSAEAAFTTCLNDPAQLDCLTDRSLCHGTGGLLATARRVAADELDPIVLTPALLLHQSATAPPDEPSGFLTGTAGATLATIGTVATSWDACLLLR